MLKKFQVLLAEAEEAIQRLNYVKRRIAEDLAHQVAEAPGKTLGAKKRKVLYGLAQEERSAVSNLDQFYRKKIFGEPKKPKPKKKVPVTDREVEDPVDEALVLTTKRPIVIIREPTLEPIQGKNDEKRISKKLLTKTYLETVAKKEYQLIPPQTRIKNILVVEDNIIDNQIIYTLEAAAAVIKAILRIYPKFQHILDLHSEPESPNNREVAAWKVQDALDFEPYKLQNTENYLF